MPRFGIGPNYQEKRKMMLKQLKDRGMAGVVEKEEHQGCADFPHGGSTLPMPYNNVTKEVTRMRCGEG
jgi:hypothetical protein